MGFFLMSLCRLSSVFIHYGMVSDQKWPSFSFFSFYMLWWVTEEVALGYCSHLILLWLNLEAKSKFVNLSLMQPLRGQVALWPDLEYWQRTAFISITWGDGCRWREGICEDCSLRLVSSLKSHFLVIILLQCFLVLADCFSFLLLYFNWLIYSNTVILEIKYIPNHSLNV